MVGRNPRGPARGAHARALHAGSSLTGADRGVCAYNAATPLLEGDLLVAAPTVLVILLIAGLAAQQPPATPAASKPEPAPAKSEPAPSTAAFDGPETPVVTKSRAARGRQDAALHRHDRVPAHPQRAGRDRGARLLHRLHARRRRRIREAAADVLVQRRPGLVVGLAAPGRARAEARRDGRRRHHAGAALPAGGQRARPGSTRPTWCSSTRSAPATAAPAKPELGSKFWGVQGDIESVGEFIRLYLTRYERWASPLFLVGESYGTTRAAGLAGHLVDRGHRVQRHPARLVDPQLPDRALHHGQRPAVSCCSCRPTPRPPGTTSGCRADLQREACSATSCARSRRWAAATTRSRWPKGDRADAAARAHEVVEAAGALHRALTRRTWTRRTCASRSSASARSCCATSERTVGPARQPLQRHRPQRRGRAARVRPEHGRDPAAVHRDLQRLRAPRRWASSPTRRTTSSAAASAPWDWGSRAAASPTPATRCASAFAKNPHMKLFVGVRLLRPGDAVLRHRVHARPPGPRPEPRGARHARRYYEAGHMMYIDVDELAALRRDVAAFIA